MKEKKEDHGKELLLPPILLLLFTYVPTRNCMPRPVSAAIQAYFQLATHQPEAPFRPAGFPNKHVFYNTILTELI